MLAKEKKRAAWSLAVGALISASILAWCYLQIRPIHAQLRTLIDKCVEESKSEPSNKTDHGHWVMTCNPDDLSDLSNLKGTQASIVEVAQTDKHYWENAKFWSLFALLVFCLPLVWYFLLDRLRELSAAISGRDRQQH